MMINFHPKLVFEQLKALFFGRSSSLILTVLVFLGTSLSAHAQVVPTKMAFQGYLTTTGGTPITTPTLMRFGLYVDGIRVWYAEYGAVAFTD
ncbi:MAG: hypothetical protein KDD25_10275, partial [Bdellovibrionales bacterium]|nr:hypothetical protein [Bdellovibrionales bacterium]